MRITVLFFCCLLLSYNAKASEYKILKVSKRKTMVLVKNSGEDFHRGAKFKITLPNDKECTLTVSKVGKRSVILSARRCDDKSLLQKGQTITSVEIEIIPNEQKPSVQINKNFAATLYYSMANTIHTSSTNSSSSIEITYESGGSLGASLEYFRARPGKFGYSGGVSYELNRSFDSQVYILNGEKVTNLSGAFSEPKPTLALLTLFANGQYMLLKGFYVQAGLNFSVLSLSNPANESDEASGGIGYQAGAGYFFKNNLAGEIIIRRVSGSITSSSIEHDATLSGLHLGIKYLF